MSVRSHSPRHGSPRGSAMHDPLLTAVDDEPRSGRSSRTASSSSASAAMAMVKSPSVNAPRGDGPTKVISSHYVALSGSDPTDDGDTTKDTTKPEPKKEVKKPEAPKAWWQKSKLLTLEDWWSVWLGLLFLAPALGCAISHFEPIEFVEWTNNPAKAFSQIQVAGILVIWPVVGLLTAVGLYCMGKPAKLFIMYGFHAVMLMTILAKFLGKQKDMKEIGLGASVWSVVIGALLSNTVFRKKMPDWLKSATCDELFIKINVVMLAVDIDRIIHLGLRGIGVAWIDTPINLLVISLAGIYIFKMPTAEAVILAAATSICGTSAAVAVATIYKVGKESYQTIVAIMSFFTVPMIPLMPVFAKVLGFKDEVTGAWIGGTVDTTGAVIASASIFSQQAATTAAIVKMLQNSIMGLVCLGLSVIILCKDPSAKSLSCGEYLTMVWDRFPKFVLGFLGTSILISYTIQTKSDENLAIQWSFCIGEWVGTMGFVAIGLNIRFAEMYGAMKGPSIIILYLLGQCLDATLTAVAAWVAFDYLHEDTTHK